MAMVPYRTAEGNSFMPQEWNSIRNKFNLVSGKNYVNTQLSSKFHFWIGSSGFGFDPYTLVPTASDNVWEDYLKSNATNAKAAKFRYETLSRAEDLRVIFEGRIATGVYAQASSSAATTSRSNIPTANANVATNLASYQSPIRMAYPIHDKIISKHPT
jgi:hypothetical protein